MSKRHRPEDEEENDPTVKIMDFWSKMKKGDMCDVFDTDKIWMRGIITDKMEDGGILVHYVGFSSSWDELFIMLSNRIAPLYTHVPATTFRRNLLTLHSPPFQESYPIQQVPIRFKFWDFFSTLPHLHPLQHVTFTNCKIKTQDILAQIFDPQITISLHICRSFLFSAVADQLISTVQASKKLEQFTFIHTDRLHDVRIFDVIPAHPSLSRVCIHLPNSSVSFSRYIYYTLFRNTNLKYLHYVMGSSPSLALMCQMLSPLDNTKIPFAKLESFGFGMDAKLDPLKGDPVDVIQMFVQRMKTRVFSQLKTLWIFIDIYKYNHTQCKAIAHPLILALIKSQHPTLQSIHFSAFKSMHVASLLDLTESESTELTNAIRDNPIILDLSCLHPQNQYAIQINRHIHTQKLVYQLDETLRDTPLVVIHMIADFIGLDLVHEQWMEDSLRL